MNFVVRINYDFEKEGVSNPNEKFVPVRYMKGLGTIKVERVKRERRIEQTRTFLTKVFFIFSVIP